MCKQCNKQKRYTERKQFMKKNWQMSKMIKEKL